MSVHWQAFDMIEYYTVRAWLADSLAGRLADDWFGFVGSSGKITSYSLFAMCVCVCCVD